MVFFLGGVTYMARASLHLFNGLNGADYSGNEPAAVERTRGDLRLEVEVKPVGIGAGALAGRGKESAFWTPDREDVLRNRLPNEPDGKSKAIDKLRTLHPKLKKLNTIEKRLDGTALNGLAVWMLPEFWKKEIDLALIEGIHGGRPKRLETIERIRAVWPELETEALLERMEKLAAETQPVWFQKSFWRRLDPILLPAIKLGTIGERKAVDKVIKLYPELRIERVWARIRELRRRKHKIDELQAGPFTWTEELEQHLLALYREMGLKEAVSTFSRERGWPRDAILRKVHKLGVPRKRYEKKQEWSEIDRTFLLLSIRHMPVKRIARQLERREKAVWVQIWREGLAGACEEGYSRRELCRKFHISPATLRGWIRAERLKEGAGGRIPERSVRAFLRQHSELVDWNRLDSDAREWVVELSAKEDDGVGGDGVANVTTGTPVAQQPAGTPPA
jgi:hypothetical protein